MTENITLSPSLLACDFAKIGDQLAQTSNAGVKYIHLDVMDGVFVPNISFGIPVIKSIRRSSDLVFDTHLMITEPERYIKQFADAGSDYITFHVEATEDPNKVIALIRECGKKPGISLKPKTPAPDIFPYLPYVDLVLVMSVEPGFGGQKFMADMMPKVADIRRELDRISSHAFLSVDGGVDAVTAPTCINAGANMLVAGSAVYGKPDISEAVHAIIG